MVTTLNGNTRNRLMTFSYHTKLLLWCCCSRKAKMNSLTQNVRALRRDTYANDNTIAA